MSGAPIGIRLMFQRPADLSWHDKALCQQTDPEKFFPEKGGSTASAKRVCRACAVRTECLDYAIENSEPHGIWGGLSVGERNEITQQQAAS